MSSAAFVEISRTIRQHGMHTDPMASRALFGDFVLDIGRQELSRAGEPIHISRKALQLLDLILRSAPDAVSKDDAYRRLWGDVFVEETNIANLVSELRNALGDDSRNPRMIRTLYRFGYRFDGSVQWEEGESQPPPRSWLVWSNRDYALAQGENVIGRDPSARVAIESAAISRRHARLTITDRALLEDLGSKNGTFVGGERITGPVEIRDGDTVAFGSIRVVFRMVTDLAPTVTELKPLA